MCVYILLHSAPCIFSQSTCLYIDILSYVSLQMTLSRDIDECMSRSNLKPRQMTTKPTTINNTNAIPMPHPAALRLYPPPPPPPPPSSTGCQCRTTLHTILVHKVATASSTSNSSTSRPMQDPETSCDTGAAPFAHPRQDEIRRLQRERDGSKQTAKLVSTLTVKPSILSQGYY